MAEFHAPTDADTKELALRWVSARNLIREEYAYEINQSEDDLTYVQRVVDDELIDFQDAYALECLGVVLGSVLANNVDGLDWWICEDEYGRAPVIRYEQTSLQFDAVNLLGKRLSKGQPVNVLDLYSWVFKKTQGLKDKVD